MRMRHPWRAALALTLFSFAVAGSSAAQDVAQPGGRREQGGGRGQFAGMQRLAGVVTAVNGDHLTVKTEEGSFQVIATPNTRIMRGQGETVKLADLKAGDGVMAMGNLDAPSKTLHAAMLFTTDAEQVKKQMANLGKTFISGKVTALDTDALKMTVMRPDGVAQTIGFDETTSFKRGGRGRVQFNAAGATPAAGAESGESITLADIKVGDTVAGQGSVKAGVFVPTQLHVMAPRAGRAPHAPGSAPAGDNATPGQPQ